jgi:hypothetical protein
MPLLGRDSDIQRLLTGGDKVVLLVGDAGIGKSEVLRVSQDDTSESLAPPPVSLRSAPGSLQRGLLESLASALAEITSNQSAAERVGSLLVSAAGRVVDLRLKDLASGVGRQLLGIVSSRVSPELAGLLSDFAQQLVTTVDAELAARINNASDPDVVDLVCNFASEMRELTDGRNLVLALDDGDLLNESDRRRVADLSTLLPDGVCVRIAFSTWNAQTRDHVDELAQRGVKNVELEGLSETAVGEWLSVEGLPAEWAPRVVQTTNGYALHIAAAVELLKETRSISDLDGMQRPDVIGATTRRVWRELDTPLQVEAQRLCAFREALSPEDAANYLTLDLDVWLTIQRNLVDSRVFTGSPPWFHELRRRYIWSEILIDNERDEILSRSIRYREQQLAVPGAPPEAFVQYAQLTAQHTSLIDQDPQVAAVMSADRDEVAIAAALIELQQPTPAAVVADNVLLYAHQMFGAESDLASALQRLADKGLVHVASNALVTVVVPTWGSTEVVQLLIGRAAGELGRLPTPQLASAVFESELRPRLGPFRSGTYGLGSPRISELSGQAALHQRVQADGSILIGKLGPNLLLRYRFDGLPLYAALAYDDEVDRNAAAEALEGWRTESGGRELSVVDCLVDPTSCVPSLRFFLAMERITGTSLVNATNGPSPHARKLGKPISLAEEVHQRALTLDVVRRLCTSEERLACSLDAPIGYLYRGTAEKSEAIQVIGRSGATPLESDLPTQIGSPFYRFELSRAAHLQLDERLGLISWHEGPNQDDPVLHELTWVFQQAARFNDTQLRIPVRLERENLEAFVAASSVRTASDAMALATALGLSDEHFGSGGLLGSTTYVVIKLDTPDPHWVPAAHAIVTVASIANETGEHTAVVHLIDPDGANPLAGASFAEATQAFSDHFEIDPASVDRMTSGVATSVLPELLGHRSSEVRFEY